MERFFFFRILEFFLWIVGHKVEKKKKKKLISFPPDFHPERMGGKPQKATNSELPPSFNSDWAKTLKKKGCNL